MERLKEIRSEVKESWWIYKWSLVGLFIYKKEAISGIIDEDFVEAMTNLMSTLEKIEKMGKRVEYRELLVIKNELTCQRESLRNNRNIWLDAWRSC